MHQNGSKKILSLNTAFQFYIQNTSRELKQALNTLQGRHKGTYNYQ